MPVTVKGPDGNTYHLPDGTDKAGAIAYFRKNNIAAKPAMPEYRTADEHAREDAPTNARFPKLGSTAYKVADFASKSLPTVGAIAGAAQVETGPAAIGLAAAGGAVGDRAQHYLDKLLYKDTPDESAKDAIISMGTQAAMAAAGEGGTRVAGGVLKRMAVPFTKAAESLRAAKAGTGVRFTPGEATESERLMRRENILEHLPGGEKVMEKFRVKQESDAASMLEKQLDAISRQHLSPEDTGKRIQKVFQDAKQSSTQAIDSKFDEARKLLGKKPGEFLTAEDFNAAIHDMKNPAPSSLLDEFGKPYPGKPHPNASAAQAKLLEARKLFQDETGRFDQELVGKILKTGKPEIIGTYFEKAGLDDLRAFNKMATPEIRQKTARNVLENILNRSIQPQDAKSIARSLHGLTEGRGRLIFGNQYDSVMEASRLLSRINRPGVGMAARMADHRVMGAAAVALGGLFGMGGLENVAKAVGAELVFSKLLSEALTRPNLTAPALTILRDVAISVTRGTPLVLNQYFQSSPATYGARSDYTRLPAGATP